MDLFCRVLCVDNIVRSCEEGRLPAAAMAETGTPPSEADLPLSTIHSPPTLERTSLLALLTPASSGEGGGKADARVAADGSVTFLKVSVQANSSPEKNAVSGNDGKTRIVESGFVILKYHSLCHELHGWLAGALARWRQCLLSSERVAYSTTRATRASCTIELDRSAEGLVGHRRCPWT